MKEGHSLCGNTHFNPGTLEKEASRSPEFKASLIYILSSRSARVYLVRHCQGEMETTNVAHLTSGSEFTDSKEGGPYTCCI